MEIVNNKIRQTIHAIEQSEGDSTYALKHLVQELSARTTNLQPLPTLSPRKVVGAAYPIHNDGYAHALDPLHDEAGYEDYMRTYGFIVGKDVISSSTADNTVRRLHEIGRQLSNNQFVLSDASTYEHIPKDPNDTPILTRGFFEWYHDNAWAQIRQSVRLYLHHALIWRRPDLWVTFDRFGVKPAEHQSLTKALPLHVDQSPAIHPQFRTIQGILALADCPAEVGTTVLAPGSRIHFQEFLPFTQPNEQYVELSDQSHPILRQLNEQAQQVPLRKGSIVTWDSRTAHANSANYSETTRYVALVAAGIAKEGQPHLRALRQQYYQSGIGKNERDAFMHASLRPRYTDPVAIRRVREPEQLTVLGEALYGFKTYGEITQ